MRAFFTPNRNRFSFTTLFKPLCCLLAVMALFLLSGCKKEIDYFTYVSELRSNILLAETEDFSLKIYGVFKEYPYAADGIPHETSNRCEVRLLAVDGAENYRITFRYQDKEYGGDMSYDNVKSEYYFSCTLNISQCASLPCIIEYGDSRVELNALSIVNSSTLSPKKILENVRQENEELFASMTDKYGFTGEIYIRLLFEDACYYYVGVIDRAGKVNAFLVNATTGKIIAQRQP